MSEEKCPVCLRPAERGRDKDYGERLQVNCPRCGPFEITATALAMLGSRADADLLTRARLSHAIRTRTTREKWLSVDSTNLDELSRHPLPGVGEQLLNFARWLAGELRDDHLGRVPYPNFNELAGTVGAVDEDRVSRLVTYGLEQGVLASEAPLRELGLSAKGWAMVEQPKKTEPSQPKPLEAPMKPPSPIIKANCNTCGGTRDAFKQATHFVGGTDDGVSWSDTYDVLECCGCHEITVRHERWFSEWDQLDRDPITGEPRLVPGTVVSYWPPATKRKKPTWADQLDDAVLRLILEEVYQALNAGLVVLASIGTRTLLDRAMSLRVGDPMGGFAGKLEKMFEGGHIGKGEQETLTAITDAGSAAAHRGYAPNAESLSTIVETVENFLQREFVLKTAAGEVRKATPKRS